ncbi:MAG TPA: FAD-linked oxidase C-terminal domain-containing protein [Isosphaeraceae bacterium]|jgi:FAD/FMN-containing dehydrogenase/Fe-S oxidoreductase|nr:FAD-linked oxidase C-terminal domain-containing protein [Isosphaeraceae bacterium]
MSLRELPVIEMAEAADGAPPAPDVAGLRAALTDSFTGEVRFDRISRALYSTDASVYQIVPCGVLVPRTEADVVATVQACARFRVPITARGGGTSQAGQSIGPGVVLDFSKYLNEVLEIHAEQRWVRVQPGCVLDDLNAALRPHGLLFAPDVSTSNRATIGGMVANNSSGARSVLYGKTIDHVQELKVVLADGSTVRLGPLDDAGVEAKCRQSDAEGACYRTVRHLAAEHADEIERRYPRILRRVGGYNLERFRPVGQGGAEPFNLAHLLVGSEGTLGIVVEARLGLVPLPRAKAVLVIQFTDLLDALAATPVILAHRPAAVEVMDQYVLDSTKLNADAARLRDFLHGDPAAILIVELYGDRPEDLPPRLEAIEAELRHKGCGNHFHQATDAIAQARIWKLRKMALGLSMAQKGDAKAISFVEDTAVAPEHLRDYIAEFLEIVARHGTQAGVYAHASVGCLHVRPVINLKTEEGVRRFEAIAEEVSNLVLKYGGALSGEHGDGLVRSPFQEKMYGSVLYQAFRELKRTFDPLGLMNPGKVVDAPPLTANLRYGPDYITPSVPTTFDFSADGGLLPAAELCAGVGACRKTREGTMCPSFQATRDERDSTRGRANALRLAITGQIGLNGLTDPALHDVLDLCLECKACKSECPTNVDMARLKAEFLHQYHKHHGVPLRNRLFGRIDRLSQIGSMLAPFSNVAARNRIIRWLNERLLGIDGRRVPPAFARRTLTAKLADLPQTEADRGAAPSRQRVFLFPDTFTNHYEPEIGLAAIALLRAADASVELRGCLPRGSTAPRCCGRPMISNGLLEEAVKNARHNVALMYTMASQGISIIACEPSCILTIKDDYPALLRGEERRQAEAVATACQTFEECLEGLLAARTEADLLPAIAFRPSPTRILVQAHCHQRSLVGTGPTMRLLKRIPHAVVGDLDTGCCGMAGSFGYEKEHYEVSRLVGEQHLFPAVRNAAEDAIVAAGFSCRLQIAHFTGRRALHPAQLLHSLLSTQHVAQNEFDFPGRV